MSTDRAHAAQAMLAIPLFYDVLKGMEETAINRVVYAPLTDHDMRQAGAAEVRAVRDFRSKVEALAKEGQSTEGKKAPA